MEDISTNAGDRIVPPLKWHGGKNYLARIIVEMMPSHIHYVEPFAGGLAVLLAKNPEGYCGIGGTGVTCPIGLKVQA